jgi:hypothetical protein
MEAKSFFGVPIPKRLDKGSKGVPRYHLQLTSQPVVNVDETDKNLSEPSDFVGLSQELGKSA